MGIPFHIFSKTYLLSYYVVSKTMSSVFKSYFKFDTNCYSVEFAPMSQSTLTNVKQSLVKVGCFVKNFHVMRKADFHKRFHREIGSQRQPIF